MDLSKYILTVDDIVEEECLDRIIMWLEGNPNLFQRAKTVNTFTMLEKEEKKIRDTSNINLSPHHQSYTARHWANYLGAKFTQALSVYSKQYNFASFPGLQLIDMQVLKYKEQGHYTFHVDHCNEIPRTMSMILLLNDDYQGGELCFADPNGSNENKVKNKKGRMILWPSNFLYPHKVSPVTKGTRYSIVCWAL